MGFDFIGNEMVVNNDAISGNDGPNWTISKMCNLLYIVWGLSPNFSLLGQKLWQEIAREGLFWPLFHIDIDESKLIRM